MARNHLGITDTGRVEAPHWHFPKQILWTIILVLAIGFSLLGLSQTLWHNPTPSTNLPPNQQANIPLVPTETPKVTSTPALTSTPSVQTIPILNTEWTSNGPDTRLPKPEPNTPLNYGIGEIIVDPGDPKVIYAIANPGPILSLVWQSTDGGNNWTFLGKRIWKAPDVYEGVKVPQSRNVYQTNPEYLEDFQIDFRETVINQLELPLVIKNSDPQTIRNFRGAIMGATETARDKEGAVFVTIALPLAPDDYLKEVEARRKWEGTGRTTNLDEILGNLRLKPGYDRLVLAPFGAKEGWLEISSPPFAYPAETDAVAVVVTADTVRLYVGGHAGKIYQTELSLLKLRAFLN